MVLLVWKGKLHSSAAPSFQAVKAVLPTYLLLPTTPTGLEDTNAATTDGTAPTVDLVDDGSTDSEGVTFLFPL